MMKLRTRLTLRRDQRPPITDSEWALALSPWRGVAEAEDAVGQRFETAALGMDSGFTFPVRPSARDVAEAEAEARSWERARSEGRGDERLVRYHRTGAEALRRQREHPHIPDVPMVQLESLASHGSYPTRELADALLGEGADPDLCERAAGLARSVPARTRRALRLGGHVGYTTHAERIRAAVEGALDAGEAEDLIAVLDAIGARHRAEVGGAASLDSSAL